MAAQSQGVPKLAPRLKNPHIGVPFNYVVTAHQAGAYRLSQWLFEFAHRTTEAAPDETVYVAIEM